MSCSKYNDILINISIMFIFFAVFILVIFILVMFILVIFILVMFTFMSEPRARPPSLSPLAVAAKIGGGG